MNNRGSLYLTRRATNDSFQESVDFLGGLIRALFHAQEALTSYKPPPVHQGIDFYDEVTRFEIHLITQALKHSGGSQQRAASLLKLKPSTLNSKIKNFKIPWKISG